MGQGTRHNYLGKNKYWQFPSFICLTRLLGQGSTKIFLSLLNIALFYFSKGIKFQNWFDKFWMNNTQDLNSKMEKEIHFRLLAPNLHEFGQGTISKAGFELGIMKGFSGFIWSGSS
ncbi:hypothetical protein ACJX0J_020035, partial [Zea mays]